MPPEPSAQATLEKAREQEKRYDWLAAANSYQQALHADSAMISSAWEIWERIGFCYQLASRQTESLEEFKKLTQLAVKAYISAAELGER